MLTKEDVIAKATEIAGLVADPEKGITWQGIFAAITKSMEVAEEVSTAFPTMTGEQKKALAIDLIDGVIDTVADLPGPDWLVRPIVKTLVPVVIDVVVSAANGDLKLG